MPNISRHLKIFLLLAWAGIAICKAQQPDTTTQTAHQTYAWLGANVGGASGCVTVGLNASITVKNNYLIIGQYLLGQAVISRPGDWDRLREYAVLFGKKLVRRKYGSIYLSTGASYTNLVQRSTQVIGYDPNNSSIYADDISRNTVGVPVYFKFQFHPLPVLAFTLDAGANINLRHTYAAVNFGIALGLFRRPGAKMYK